MLPVLFAPACVLGRLQHKGVLCGRRKTFLFESESVWVATKLSPARPPTPRDLSTLSRKWRQRRRQRVCATELFAAPS